MLKSAGDPVMTTPRFIREVDEILTMETRPDATVARFNELYRSTKDQGQKNDLFLIVVMRLVSEIAINKHRLQWDEFRQKHRGQ